MKEYQRNIKIIAWLFLSTVAAVIVHFYLDMTHVADDLDPAIEAGWHSIYDDHAPATALAHGPEDPAATTAGNSRPARLSAELLRRYNAGGNMRDFVRHALQHPEQGGYFYAVKVLQQCRGFSLVPPLPASTAYVTGQDPGRYRRASEAAERLRTRCADFDAEQIADGRTRGLFEAGRQRDPLIRASIEFSNAFQEYLKAPASVQAAQARRQALAAVLTLDDPLLYDDLNLRLALQVVDGRKGFMLGGEFHDLHSEVDVGSALYLLPCAAGLVCDEREFDVQTRCGFGGDCERSRFDHIEKMVEIVPGAYEKILLAYQAMREAIAHGDARYFANR